MGPIDLKGRRLALKEMETVLEKIKSKFERSESQSNREETIGESEAEGDDDSVRIVTHNIKSTGIDIGKKSILSDEKGGGSGTSSADKNGFSRPPFYSHVESSHSLTATVSGLQSPFVTISESDKSFPSFSNSIHGDEKYDDISDIEGEILPMREECKSNRDQIRHRFLERSERGGVGRKRLSRMSRNGTLRGHASASEDDDEDEESPGRRRSTGIFMASDTSAARAYSTCSLGNPVTELPWQVSLIKIRSGYLLQKALDNNKMRESSQDSMSAVSASYHINSVSSMRSHSSNGSDEYSRSDMTDDHNNGVSYNRGSKNNSIHINASSNIDCKEANSATYTSYKSLTGLKIPSTVCTMC